MTTDDLLIDLLEDKNYRLINTIILSMNVDLQDQETIQKYYSFLKENSESLPYWDRWVEKCNTTLIERGLEKLNILL